MKDRLLKNKNINSENQDDFELLPGIGTPERYPENLPPKVEKFLQDSGLTSVQLEQSGVQFHILSMLLNKSFSGRLLRWLALESLITKIILFLLLDERGVAYAEINTDVLDRKTKLLQWFSSVVWPAAQALPFKSTSMLKRAYGVEAFCAGIESIVSRAWSFLLASFITDDLRYYFNPGPYIRPVLKDIFSGQSANEQALVSFLARPDHAYASSIFLLVPFIWGMAQAFQASCTNTAELTDQHVEELIQVFINYKPSVYNDIVQWFLPINPIQKVLDKVRRALLWDNRLSAEQRGNLFNAFRNFVHHSRKITQFASLSVFMDIADGIAMSDLVRLHYLLEERNKIKEILLVKTQAMSDLLFLAKRFQLHHNRDKEKENFYHRRLKPIPRYLFVHYALWCIGSPQSQFLQPFFWIFKGINLYVKASFLLLLYSGLQKALVFYDNKKSCLSKGKQWKFSNVINDYNCTVCPGFVNYFQSFQMEDCLSNYLRVPRNPDQIMSLLSLAPPENSVSELDFSNQQFPSTENATTLTPILEAVLQYLPQVQLIDFTGNVGPMGVPGAQALANILPRTNWQVLILVGNDLGDQGTAIIASVLPNTNVSQLVLDDNNIADAGARALGKVLSNITTLEYVGFYANSLTINGVRAIAAGLQNSSLSAIGFGYNYFGPEAAVVLISALPGTRIQTLYFEGNYIGDPGAQALAAVLPQTQIQILYAGTNLIGPAGAIALANVLGKCSLTQLYLNYNQIGPVGTEALALALPDSQINTFDVTQNSIGLNGTRAIANVLPRCPLLTTLTLTLNYVGPEAAEILATAFKQNSSLEKLSLNDNNFLEAGGLAMADAIPYMPFLSLLDLGGNQVGPKATAAIAAVLQKSQIRRLYFHSNELGPSGIVALANALPNTGLQQVYIDGNPDLNDDDVAPFIQSLKNSSLLALYFNYYNITVRTIRAFMEVLPAAPLQELHLGANNLGDDSALVIANGLTYTPKFNHPLWLNFLYPSDLPTTIHPESITQLNLLDLGSNEIDDAGAAALCKTLQWTQIPIPSLNLNGNPVSNATVDSNDLCLTSAAASSAKPFPVFLILSQLMTGLLYPIKSSFLLLDAQVNSRTSLQESDELNPLTILSGILLLYMIYRFFFTLNTVSYINPMSFFGGKKDSETSQSHLKILGFTMGGK
jgi:Ran GTPase-activating protein (RanGAP) involved in mRNA processing and transport